MHLMSFIMLYHCSFERYHFAWHWISPKLYTPILTLGIYVRAEIETGCCRESTMLIQVDSTNITSGTMEQVLLHLTTQCMMMIAFACAYFAILSKVLVR